MTLNHRAIQAIKNRGYRRVDLLLLPAELEAIMVNLNYWYKRKHHFVTARADQYEANFRAKKISELTEIINLLEIDARQINRRLTGV